MLRRFLSHVLVNGFFVLTGMLLALAISEGTARWYFGETFRIRNFLIQDLDFLQCHRWPTIYDATLGWIPRPNSKEPDNYWKMEMLEEGFRSNGAGSLSAGGRASEIIAVGDSFTFGDQVANHETWPAQLENKLVRPVRNAGVYNYGIDQAVIRAQLLLRKYRPQLLIVSVYTDDIRRAQLSVSKGLAKPYFELQGDELVLKNNPVPPPKPLVQRLGWERGILGYSYVIHQIMKYLFPETWLVGRSGDVYVAPGGSEVSCRLLKELQHQTASVGSKMVVLLQFGNGEGHEPFDSLLPCISESHIPVLDLYAPLTALRDTNQQEYQSLFIGHMSAKGNSWVAEQLARFLQSEELLD